MKHHVISQSGSQRATLWFLGWGFDSSIAPVIHAEGDVVLLWDYTSLALDLDLSAWQSFDVCAWSMGVWAAESFVTSHPELTFGSLTAINGTPLPADAEQGIGARLIQATALRWDDRNRRKFALRIAGDAQTLAQVEPLMTGRETQDQKAELESILAAQANPPSTSLTWDRAIIGTADQIFTPDAQRRYWAAHARQIDERDMPHWPFPKD